MAGKLGPLFRGELFPFFGRNRRFSMHWRASIRPAFGLRRLLIREQAGCAGGLLSHFSLVAPRSSTSCLGPARTIRRTWAGICHRLLHVFPVAIARFALGFSKPRGVPTVFAGGTGSLFPTSTYNSTSYGVDVVFRPQLAAA